MTRGEGLKGQDTSRKRLTHSVENSVYFTGPALTIQAWAHAHPGAEAMADDLAGHRCAAALGIPVISLFFFLTFIGQICILRACALVENQAR